MSLRENNTRLFTFTSIVPRAAHIHTESSRRRAVSSVTCTRIGKPELSMRAATLTCDVGTNRKLTKRIIYRVTEEAIAWRHGADNTRRHVTAMQANAKLQVALNRRWRLRRAHNLQKRVLPQRHL